MKTQFLNSLKLIAELGKLRITVAVTMTSAMGYVLNKGVFDWTCLFAIIGTLILAMGASSLNQYQEVEYDRLMERTSNRPIVAGRVSKRNAFYISMILIFFGLYVLVVYCNLNAFYFGVASVVWYNLIYTPMKRFSYWAVFPGALIGALPPMIGWAASDGRINEPFILFFAFFIFVWQIPHFWLLLLIYDDEYLKAGYPTLSEKLNVNQIQRITFAWIVSLVSFSFLIPVFSDHTSKPIYILLIIMAVYLLKITYKILNKQNDKKIYRSSFNNINIYVLLILVLLLIDRFVNF